MLDEMSEYDPQGNRFGGEVWKSKMATEDCRNLVEDLRPRYRLRPRLHLRKEARCTSGLSLSIGTLCCTSRRYKFIKNLLLSFVLMFTAIGVCQLLNVSIGTQVH